MKTADGIRWLCDQAASRTADDCASDGLQLIGGDGFGTEFIGVKSGNALQLLTHPTSPPSLDTIHVNSGPPST
jgi:hypothetical protein